MKNKKMLMTLGLIAVLGLYIGLRGRHCGSTVPSPGSWNADPDEIIIQRPAGTITLRSTGGKWVVGAENFPADEAGVASIIDKMKKLEITDRVSSEGQYAPYDLVPEKVITVTVRSGGRQIRSLAIGKKSSTYRHTYARVNDSADVLLVAGTFDQEFSRPLDEFRDRDIVKTGKEDVDMMEIVYMGKTFSFTKNPAEAPPQPAVAGGKNPPVQPPAPATWTCRGFEKRKVITEKMDSLLASLQPLKAWGFSGEDKNRLKNPLCTVKIKVRDRETVLSIFSPDKDKRHPVTTGDSPYVFLAEDWKVNRFMIKSADEYLEK